MSDDELEDCCQCAHLRASLGALRALHTAERERADRAEVREKTWHDAALAAKAERDALLKRVKHTEKLCEQHWLARDEADKRTKAAEAERDALRERADRAEALANKESQRYESTYCQLEKAEAERDALRADAERYRWLRRRNELTEADSSGGPFVIDLLSDDTTIHYVTGPEIDAAIDAARGK